MNVKVVLILACDIEDHSHNCTVQVSDSIALVYNNILKLHHHSRMRIMAHITCIDEFSSHLPKSFNVFFLFKNHAHMLDYTPNYVNEGKCHRPQSTLHEKSAILILLLGSDSIGLYGKELNIK